MALYIRDDDVDELARKAQKLLKAPTKTEAVRQALIREIERVERQPSLGERLRPFQEQLKTLGPANPDFDMKEFMDESWDNL
ncbi:MAG: type II toxin-antitoxin system VapB family antitoxin [Rhizobiaceae bacterium]|jgi:antitoxin VapB